LIVFPEMVDTGYSMPAIQKHATSWNEGAVPKLQAIAKELSLAIIAGVSDRDGSRIYNAQVFIDVHGKVSGKYRKTHLVTAAPLVAAASIAHEELIQAEISEDVSKSVRNRMAVFAHRRKDLY